MAGVVALMIAAGTSACGGGGGGGGGAGSGQRFALDPLGITIELPAGSTVDTENASDTRVKVMTPELGALEVTRADDFDLAAEQAHQETYGITDFATEDVPGGTVITYTYREVGQTYYVHQVLVTVDGRRFSCGFSGIGRTDKRESAWFVGPCKTLRKK